MFVDKAGRDGIPTYVIKPWKNAALDVRSGEKGDGSPQFRYCVCSVSDTTREKTCARCLERVRHRDNLKRFFGKKMVGLKNGNARRVRKESGDESPHSK